MLISIGDQVRDGTYELHSRFPRVVNFVCGNNLACVVSTDIGEGPLNLVLQGPYRMDFASLHIRGEQVCLDSHGIHVAGTARYTSDLPSISAGQCFVHKTFVELERVVVAEAPEGSLAFLLDNHRLNRLNGVFERAVAHHMLSALKLLLSGDIRRGVQMARGCGSGLTPGGDDLLCGLLIGLRALGSDYLNTVASAVGMRIGAPGSNLLSESFLVMAKEGRVSSPVKELVGVLLRGPVEKVRSNALRVMEMGATSGSDMATGLVLAGPRFLTRKRNPNFETNVNH